ncbi:dipeptidyl aminopeptidase B [Apiospora saccharicola]
MTTASPRPSTDSLSTVSTTSLVFERISEREKLRESNTNFDDEDPLRDVTGDEREAFLGSAAGGGPGKYIAFDRKMRKILLIATGLIVAAWGVGLFIYLTTTPYATPDPTAASSSKESSKGSAKKITMDQVQSGYWYPTRHDISWIAGANGEDGLLLEQGSTGKDYLVIEDVHSLSPEAVAAGTKIMASQTLMRNSWFSYKDTQVTPDKVWPSPDLKKVLVASHVKSNWRHSFTAIYWVFDVETQTAEPLDPKNPDLRVQLAQWSPKSNAISYTAGNNLYIRRLGGTSVTQVTKDGGPEYFYGIPDWVYEEEVFGGNSATWWSNDGQYMAFLRTNETLVPEFPVQYFIERPSGTKPQKGEENYPEVRQIKYPKAGSPNPFVDLLFYDLARGDMFSVDISGGFTPEDLLITEIVWAGDKVIIKETNRVSDIMRVVLVDAVARSGQTVRTVDVGKIDGGWFEIGHNTRYIPADPANGRAKDGYVDQVIHDDGDHLAYFTPLDNPEPIMLTSGKWEVDEAPSAVDLKNNLVYFHAAKESSIQRHVYSVKLDGSDLRAIVDTKSEGIYEASFSSKAGYTLLTYKGPKVPWQKVINTPNNTDKFEYIVEDNKELVSKVQKYDLPILNYGTINVDGFELNFLERRPPNFNKDKKYPVLFQQYSGPGSQSVKKSFSVDFQAFVAANLGYIVVTVDGRGTGFIGRKARVCVRKELGKWEAHDQIAAAKIWAAKPYIDATRLAIWGWSYGGFNTLKTLEQDAGQTFSYGMAVAPVTDWRFYDSIYTERYMLTPQENEGGYSRTAISNATALSGNVRFLIMHGVADDNVHMQNTLTLLDKLDLANVENYDLHMFPDSDHGIYFHNANRIVYDKLTNWLINAFNGEWLKITDAKPNPIRKRSMEEIQARGDIGISVTGGGANPVPLSLLSGLESV